MYRKCNIHVLESCVAISKLFDKLKDKLETSITLKTHAVWKIPQIDENSTIGQQIKYYRRLANIKQTDLSLKLGYTRQALHHIENMEMKLVDINLIKDVIKELDIADKITINDDYIAFLLDNPSKKIFELRKKLNLTRPKFADLINVSMTSVKRWENGNSHISREMYERLKKCMS